MLACCVSFEFTLFGRAVGVNPLFLAELRSKVETGDSRPPLAWIRCKPADSRCAVRLEYDMSPPVRFLVLNRQLLTGVPDTPLCL